MAMTAMMTAINEVKIMMAFPGPFALEVGGQCNDIGANVTDMQEEQRSRFQTSSTLLPEAVRPHVYK